MTLSKVATLSMLDKNAKDQRYAAVEIPLQGLSVGEYEVLRSHKSGQINEGLKDNACIDVHDLMGPMHSGSVKERTYNGRLTTSSKWQCAGTRCNSGAF